MKTCENCKHWIPMKELEGKCVLYGLKYCAWTPAEATCDEWANEESEVDEQYADLKKTLWDIDISQYKKGAESEDRHYIRIYADDEPSVKAEKLYQICGETQNKEVTEWLKEYFPSIEVVQGWIPCSERLPTQTGEYLATVDYNGCIFTDKFCYEPTTDGGWYDEDAPNQRLVDWNKLIVAWMPLPKPYRKESEVEE